MTAEGPDAADGDASTGSSRSRWVRIAGRVVAVVAVALCVWTVVRQWDTISGDLRSADLLLLGLAFVVSALAGLVLATAWWYCLRIIAHARGMKDVLAWYFGGEIGKYLPGGIWAIVGRGELSLRGGIDRRTSYASTLLSLGAIVVSGAWFCGVVGPLAVAIGDAPTWVAWFWLAIPVGAGLLHPRVVGLGLRLMHVALRGERMLGVPSWGAMTRLTLLSLPSWLFVGGAAVLVTASLGYVQSPEAVAMAAVAAWTVGIVAVPVPAGAGLREIVFAALCGLGTAPGVVVAGVSRLLYVLVDGAAALVAFAYLRRWGRLAPLASSEEHDDR